MKRLFHLFLYLFFPCESTASNVIWDAAKYLGDDSLEGAYEHFKYMAFHHHR